MDPDPQFPKAFLLSKADEAFHFYQKELLVDMRVDIIEAFEVLLRATLHQKILSSSVSERIFCMLCMVLPLASKPLCCLCLRQIKQ